MSKQNKSDNEKLNRNVTNIVPNTQPKVCSGCDGKGWQARTTDGVKVTCPMCCGTGTFTPPGTVIWKVNPQPVYIVPNPSDEKPKPDPGWDYLAPDPPTYPGLPQRNPYYVGDDPRDWGPNSPNKVIC